MLLKEICQHYSLDCKNLYICKIVKKKTLPVAHWADFPIIIKQKVFFFNLQKFFSFIDLTLDILFKNYYYYLIITYYYLITLVSYELRTSEGGLYQED